MTAAFGRIPFVAPIYRGAVAALVPSFYFTLSRENLNLELLKEERRKAIEEGGKI
jgi:hypothetical protein